MTTPAEQIDRLRRLRERFLRAKPGQRALADYWSEDADLEVYDAVFAERIGWKWDAVLDEIEERGFARADDQLVVDWGCGTGIAARRVAARFGAGAVALHDRSTRAMAFAEQRLRADHPELEISRLRGDEQPDLLLVSHVLNELDSRGERLLLGLAERSRRVLWVESGTHPVSRRLSAIRDQLCENFAITAPCTHHDACSALSADDDRHWCHFFGQPPTEVFHDGDWVRLARELGLDLRALPYAFLALERDATPAPDGSEARLLGRPQVGRHDARFFACDLRGLHQLDVTKRAVPALWKAMRKHPERLRRLDLDHDGSRVSAWRAD